MGTFRILSAIQRLVGRREDESQNYNKGGVRLFSTSAVLAISYEPGLTFKDVCENAAKEVGILPINLPFFSLVTVNGGHVMNLQKTLTENECNEHYEFRLVFKGCHPSWFADKDCFDKNALVYLFHQCRHDFLKDPTKLEFTYNSENDSGFSKKDIDTHFVKAVLCEIVYQAKQNDVKASHVLDKVKHFKINHLLRRGLFANLEMEEVKSYLRKFLGDYEKLEELRIKREFLNCTDFSNNYFVYKFDVNTAKKNYVANRMQNVSYELLISVQFGIQKKRKCRDEKEQSGGQKEENHAEVIVENFSDVSRLEIDQVDSNKLTVFRVDATPQVLLAQSKEDAQSIVAIIDGYYKLLVNRYKSLTNQGPVKVHGPIRRERAVSKIQEHGTDDGLFLIRKSRVNYNQYILSLYCNKECEHYQVLEENGEFFIKNTNDKFKDLNDLVKHYEENKGGLVCCLKKNCPPSDEGFDALLDIHQDVPTSERPQDLSEFGETINNKTIKLRTELPEIGQGEYGSVIKAEWWKEEKEKPVNVVIRKVKKVTYDQKFFEEGKRLVELKNQNVIRCHGIVRMRNELGIVFEFVSQPLDDFLMQRIKDNYSTLTTKTVTQYSVQIAIGMMFLQEKEIVHGQLCAHNVLVPSDPTNVKISDAGLADLKNHGAQFFPGKKKSNRHCWHAPELLNPKPEQNTNPTHESDIWSFGVTLWEMFTLKKPFYRTDGTWLSKEEVLNVLIRKEYLDTERDSIPKVVANIIQKCWLHKPEERMTFKNSHKKLRNFLMLDGSVTTNSSTTHQQEPDQIMELQDHPVPDPDQKKQKRGYQPAVPDAQLEDHHMQPLNHEDGTDDGSSSQGSSNYEQKKQMTKQHSIEQLKNGVQKKFRIYKQDLTWKNKLGEGQFGIVYEGIWSKVGLGAIVPMKKRVAIKELRKTADDKSQEDFIKEAINMSKLAVRTSSKHIIEFIGICLDENEDIPKPMIITELAPFGNLENYLNKVKKKGDTFKLSVLVDFCVQICNGMVDLESNNVLHRDIALRNILVASEDPYLIKISDFGLARLNDYYKGGRGRFPLRWYAPESITHHRFTSKSDVWSFGVAMWEVFSYGAQPYPEIQNCNMVIYHICKGNRLPKPVNCPDDIYDIMKQCWDYDPKSRPSFYELSRSLLDDIKNKYCKQEQ